MGESKDKITCLACGALNEGDATFCKQCGKRVDGKIPCNACNEPNETDALFCKKCGARLKSATAVSVPPTAQPQSGTPAPAPAPHSVKVCPSCGKVNSEKSTFCLRCSRSLADVTATQPAPAGQTNVSGAGSAGATAAMQTSVAPVVHWSVYETEKHVLSLLLALATLLFVFLVRMEGTFLYKLFDDTYQDLPGKLAVPYRFGAAVYLITIIGVCLASVLAIVCDLMHFFSNRLPEKLDKAWAVNAFLIYAAGITLLQTVLNGSTIISTLGGSCIAGLIVCGMLAVLYTYFYLQDSPFESDGQLPRVIALCLLIAVWVLVAGPQFSFLEKKTEMSVKMGYMPLLYASQLVDAGASVGTYVAGQVFQLLVVFALCDMVWLCLFQNKIDVRFFVQTALLVLFALLHLIAAYIARGKYLDLVMPKKSTGGWGSYYPDSAAQSAGSVTLSAAKTVGVFILCLVQAIATCAEYYLCRRYE